MIRIIVIFFALLALSVTFAVAAEADKKTELITSFEDDADSSYWGTDGEIEVVAAHPTDGKSSLKVLYPADPESEKRCYSEEKNLESLFPLDWSGYKTLKIDVYNDNAKEAALQVRIKSTNGKKVWSKKFIIPSKKTETLEISMEDLKTKIDLEEISNFAFGMGKNRYLTEMLPLDVDYTLYFDNIKMIKK